VFAEIEGNGNLQNWGPLGPRAFRWGVGEDDP